MFQGVTVTEYSLAITQGTMESEISHLGVQEILQMKKDGVWVKIFGDDVDDVLLVTFLEDDVIEIDAFRGREKRYTMEAPKSGIPRAEIRRIGEGKRFQIYFRN